MRQNVTTERETVYYVPEFAQERIITMQRTVIDSLDVLDDLEVYLEGVTEAQMLRAQRKLPDVGDGEKVIGAIHNESVKRMHVALPLLRNRGVELASQSEIADSDEEERKAHEDSHKFRVLYDVLKEMYWAQIRSDTGCWSESRIGLRRGWTAVTCEDNRPDGLAALISGLIPMPKTSN